MPFARLGALPAALLLLVACGDDDAALADGGTPDARMPDAGVDSGPPPPSRAAAAPLTQWVDPFIGTGGLGFGVGSSFPGPQRPFGMARPGPDTTEESGAPAFVHCAGYYYLDEIIRGFSQTRMHGTGIADYGHVGVMPTVGMSAEKTHHTGYRQRFSHDTEEASPGYYAVTLEDTGVRVELTATERTGVHRFTFPAASDAIVLVDVGYFMADNEVVDGRIEIDPAAGEIRGMHHVQGGYSDRYGGVPAYFVARFDRAWARHGVWKAGVVAEGETMRTGNDAGAFFGFDTTTDADVQLAIGISFVDEAHARMNLDAEVPSLDFDAVRADAEAAWEAELSRVEIEGRTERDFEIFYSALYHVMLMPTLFSDVDGSYRGLDREVHVADGFRYYTDLSLWDTFRTLHPLLTLLYPDVQRDILRSMVAMAADGGYMPRWPLGIGYTGGMVGESATIVFADSWAKGVRDFDLRAAFDAMMITASGPVPAGAPYGGRGGIEDYLALGYASIESGGSSASETLEYAYDDWALSILADALGETALAATLRERGRNYRHLWDPSVGFLIGRHRDGSFPADVDPLVWEDYYAEGNAWQYTWYAPHDLEGLAEVMGGREAMLTKLDELFHWSERERRSLGPDMFYWHGNEPDLHYAWIYSAMDRPADTARWSRYILDTRYGDGPDGLPGNDDAGTMSAWYVFAASGFYAIAGTDYYLVGSPLLTRVTMHLPGGDFVVSAPEASAAHMYVESATLEGAPLDRARFPHAAIADGGELVLGMTHVPSAWATQ